MRVKNTTGEEAVEITPPLEASHSYTLALECGTVTAGWDDGPWGGREVW
jgi:hypothetical protein